MQRDLDGGSTWGMKFNAKKCNIMGVSHSRKIQQHFYNLGNEILQAWSDLGSLAGLGLVGIYHWRDTDTQSGVLPINN